MQTVLRPNTEPGSEAKGGLFPPEMLERALLWMKERIWQEGAFPSSWLWSEQVAPNLSMWWGGGMEAGGERMKLKI